MRLSDALWWSSRGFHVFPLKPKSKEPATLHGCKDATDSPLSWPPAANIGVAFHGNQFCLDIDPRAGGHLTLDSLEAEHGPLPRTFTQLTGGVVYCPTLCCDVRGRHYVFTAERPVRGGKLRQFGDPLQGIDLKAPGGYIVGAPSIHPSGGRYEILHDVPIAQAPDWLIRLTQPAIPPAPPIPALYDNVFFPLPIETAARAFRNIYATYGPNRRETIAYYTYRLFHLMTPAAQTLDYLTRANAAMVALSPHTEEFDAQAWINLKINQVYRQGNIPQPPEWRVRQILSMEFKRAD